MRKLSFSNTNQLLSVQNNTEKTTQYKQLNNKTNQSHEFSNRYTIEKQAKVRSKKEDKIVSTASAI
ncbi:hypothetical protein BpHYR1_026893 [Brachionus plicatilis]|uniref:Uncharacterized protein n=1 Tax=Brachionus plicatilis TaxID=10195 RepID=A0A3M7T927_BRAPC|nr:hypothetical protein BpHYR1_026893 [Brachionus plicatilis]